MRLTDIQIKHYNDTLDALHNGESVKGWRVFVRSGEELDAYYNKTEDMVIKLQNFINDDRTPLKFRVPTVKLDNNGYVVQPLVEKRNLTEALKILRVKMKPYFKRGIFPDLHRYNIGWYKNKPLMFDW